MKQNKKLTYYFSRRSPNQVETYLTLDNIDKASEILAEMRGDDTKNSAEDAAEWAVTPTGRCAEIVVLRVAGDKDLVSSGKSSGLRLAHLGKTIADQEMCYLLEGKKEAVGRAFEFALGNGAEWLFWFY